MADHFNRDIIQSSLFIGLLTKQSFSGHRSEDMDQFNSSGCGEVLKREFQVKKGSWQMPRSFFI
ncbi:hypothetical protein SC09_Contig24orf00107 [Bacillus subtilis]|uniref:Uncharacterized protein n=1 Tax=Bacillus subtilis TaxID=1423 RepID=A0A0D1KYJ0_BACIU|nr:hypothetical protein SC09_Contig24orf00107 [Bacillus subtilis]